jgi:CHAT domain-containing protein
LGETTPNSVAQAFGYVEQARSRALADALGAPIQAQTMPQDSHEKTLHDQLHTLYAELNWFYNQINRPPEDIPRTSAELHALRQAMREREAQAAEIERQLQQRGTAQLPQSEQASITAIQAELGDTTALVEYFFLDDELIAFVITDSQVVAHRGLAREAEIAHAVRQLYFQLDTFRYGATQTRPYVHQLEQRARHYLADLYNLLLRPLEHDLGERRLVVSPSRQLHYVPFHALYDGKEYVLERREVCSTPSASILRYSRQAMQQRSIDRAVLLGIADEQTPRVHEELITISAHFPQARMLLNNSATLAMLQKHAPEADILHLASHAQFRQDNPRFSALRLADGWLTVRDAAALDLRCTLVTLSACETGVNAVAPGDELLGLLRGFFSAGAASLLVSLWAVDDAATAELMADFYAHLRNQQPPGAALRQAQENARQNYTHPFFWAPFVYIGGW